MLETLQKVSPTDEVRMDDTGRQSAGNSQLDWLAGLIDGEGSLLLARKLNKTGSYNYRPTVSVANTHKPTIDRIAEIFKDHGLGVWVCCNRDKRGRYQPEYSVFVCGYKRVRRFLELMRTRLFTKRRQADLLFEYIQSREADYSGCKESKNGSRVFSRTEGGHPGRKLSETELKIVEEIKKANHTRYWYGSPETLCATPDRRLNHGWRVKIKSTPAPETQDQRV